MEFLNANVETIGFWAALLTTVAFAPQVIRSWRVGGNELSWLMLSLFGAGVGLWFVYGYLRSSGPLMVANALTGIQVVLILGIKVRAAILASRSSDSTRSPARRAPSVS